MWRTVQACRKDESPCTAFWALPQLQLLLQQEHRARCQLWAQGEQALFHTLALGQAATARCRDAWMVNAQHLCGKPVVTFGMPRRMPQVCASLWAAGAGLQPWQ